MTNTLSLLKRLDYKPTILSETYLCEFELCEQHNYTHYYFGAKLFCTNRGAHAVQSTSFILQLE